MPVSSCWWLDFSYRYHSGVAEFAIITTPSKFGKKVLISEIRKSESSLIAGLRIIVGRAFFVSVFDTAFLSSHRMLKFVTIVFQILQNINQSISIDVFSIVRSWSLTICSEGNEKLILIVR